MADLTYQPKAYRKDGGDTSVIASGGVLDIESGGAFKLAGTAISATAAELNAACDLSAQKMTCASGFKGTGTICESSVVKQGGIIKTEILIDLTDAKSMTTDLDIIGHTGVSYIGQITEALNGTLLFGQVTCLETPATGVTTIDFYSATEDTGAFDAGVSSLDEVVMLTGSAWTAAVTHVMFTNLPAANKYMYLASGAAGTTGTYSAGRFLLEFWGV